MEYKLVKKDEAFEKLLGCLNDGYTIYAVRVSRSKDFDDQWVRFYYINTDSRPEDITAEIAALFEFQMVYGEPAVHINGCEDVSAIVVIEHLSDLLFNYTTALEYCRL